MNRSTDLYVDGKRHILVADDEMINRELLQNILSDEYDVLMAEDGEMAYDVIRQNRNTLSLILLDLMMPKLNGLDLLSRLKEDPDLKGIPVIVLTSDQASEVESLVRGAADFIPKPYPQPDVIRARISRSIELAEDRQIISATERDELTGLYSYEYFYRYAEQFDKYHPNSDMDALCLDVNHFHIVNERFGMAKGDEILRRIAGCLMMIFSASDCVICRKTADTFLVYCSHRDDYTSITDKVSEVCCDMPTSVKLRIGVYASCDKKLDVRARFDRAKIAADLIRNNYSVFVSTFDEKLMENELFAEQLVDEFPKALAEKQFKVFFQPKFNIAGDKPVLSSAEALVRWFHPTLGMISPGKFIPLFEEDGLIAQLDEYIWRTAAETIADWKKRLGVSVPVSVNLSRAEMYDPALVETFGQILDENGLAPGEIHLEITESAYTQDSEQIIGTVNRLRELGYTYVSLDLQGFRSGAMNEVL